ncbi:Low affinity iron permease, Fet4 [Moelleriella libera RCEF 2490]|uniref:Low affinity iron permease, Fet4 n=1 Tax=Moelleriella libera RCEF 2490 TaxID=1081109 RepID=A0A162I8W3_9HYPO|nr:Low affinity iron permease, Fet4 [Moelleriella libera RCEF 2490]
MFRHITDFLSAPGTKGETADRAPTQHVLSALVSGGDEAIITTTEGKVADSSSTSTKKSEPSAADDNKNVTGYVAQSKPGKLDRWLDGLVKASGSEPVFLLIVAGLLVWALTGIRYGQQEDWAALISDIQAIVSYLFDSLLMRQQLNGYERQLRVSASLRSRIASQRRMMRRALASGRLRPAPVHDYAARLPSGFGPELPAENTTSRLSNAFAAFLGHFATICMYWAGIFVWLGFGAYCGWSDRWQLYINSATSALMVLIFAFLANIRERHDAYVGRCLNAIFEVDSEAERKLRVLTGDVDENPVVVIPAPEVNRLQRAIFYYADVVGTLVGIALLIVVMVVWVGIGPVMQWSDNWWLLIGTYAGLVGLVDGFVLRNVQQRLHQYEETALESVKLEDVALSDEIGVPMPVKTTVNLASINYRLSNRMGVICAHETTVLMGIVLVVGLIVGASAMKWTTTGQLLCNIPPSIIESFFMMILITGHNLSEAGWRADLHNMYMWRLRLLSYVDHLQDTEVGLAAVAPSKAQVMLAKVES